ncbi:Cobalamin synthase [Thalassovita gelatinovora]|uniref:Adenosylcobinamide-GDP ribazoletransferase n=1 Tax=Thalassovita gelatinovora TaxID=53501 RepID=A0A0P1FSB4_THAGE|nr:adenosylcobinamide-GDP ribazoletransferase [Thalassovita gelatinovora]QIZ82257.1 adenosylcobinamide-GDP ribazoletransferase [Thalassovita gelatinovora]CUH63793.1 Cobalamin synthase [Thalassovita gelatinovora]SEQ97574.1 cobalamin-5'-phosphate synthase [Thalassovita gelatinovora]
MRENDTFGMQWRDVAVAVGLLTRLPVSLPDAAYERGARAAWAYPLAGAVVAVLGAILAALSQWVGLGPQAVALLVLLALVMLTGAMHEDGLADSADGLWGGWNRARRLDIMKDSHIGSYGVIALVLSLAARWGGLSVLLGQDGGLWALVAVAALSRSGMPVLMAWLPNARDGGLSRAQGRPDWRVAGIGVAVALGLALLCLGMAAFGLTLLALIVAAAVGLMARAKIGGQTGDILGASQQMCEIVLLLALSAA